MALLAPGVALVLIAAWLRFRRRPRRGAWVQIVAFAPAACRQHGEG